MPSALSIKIGDFLYKNAFPIYNVIYPFFKRKQDKHEIALLKQYVKKRSIAQGGVRGVSRGRRCASTGGGRTDCV